MLSKRGFRSVAEAMSAGAARRFGGRALDLLAESNSIKKLVRDSHILEKRASGFKSEVVRKFERSRTYLTFRPCSFSRVGVSTAVFLLRARARAGARNDKSTRFAHHWPSRRLTSTSTSIRVPFPSLSCSCSMFAVRKKPEPLGLCGGSVLESEPTLRGSFEDGRSPLFGDRSSRSLLHNRTCGVKRKGRNLVRRARAERNVLAPRTRFTPHARTANLIARARTRARRNGNFSPYVQEVCFSNT